MKYVFDVFMLSVWFALGIIAYGVVTSLMNGNDCQYYCGVILGITFPVLFVYWLGFWFTKLRKYLYEN